MKVKTLIMLLAAILAVVSLSEPSDARHNTGKDTGDDKTPTSKKHKRKKEPTTRKKSLLKGMHARMAKVCKMDEQQQERVAELNNLRRKEEKDFKAENAAKFKVLKARITEARKNQDKKAMKEAYTEIRDLRARQKQIGSRWQSRIMGILTPEQKSQWDKYQVMLSIKRRFRNAKLTDDQKAQTEAACVNFIKGVNLSDKKARHKVVKKLAEYIRKEILTDAQRKTMSKPARKTTTKPVDSAKPVKVKKPA